MQWSDLTHVEQPTVGKSQGSAAHGNGAREGVDQRAELDPLAWRL